MKRILITGGLGYLGSRIAEYLYNKPGNDLNVTTRKQYDRRPEWMENGRIITLEMTSENDLDAACEGVQCIIHLAALNEIESAENPEWAMMVNGIGTLKLLQAAERTGVERIIYFSTAHVYGSPLQGHITEHTLPRPIHPYAITHRIAEDFVLAAHDRKALTGIVLRLSNGFGAPVNPDVNRWTLLVNDLCRQAVTTGRLVLRSSGAQFRDFVTIYDVCRAVYHFTNLPADQCLDGLFNLGGECTIRVIEMVQRIVNRCSAVLGFTPEIVLPEKPQEEDVSEFEYSVKKLKKTGFKPRGDINKEIDATLLFCRNQFNNIFL